MTDDQNFFVLFGVWSASEHMAAKMRMYSACHNPARHLLFIDTGAAPAIMTVYAGSKFLDIAHTRCYNSSSKQSYCLPFPHFTIEASTCITTLAFMTEPRSYHRCSSGKRVEIHIFVLYRMAGGRGWDCARVGFAITSIAVVLVALKVFYSRSTPRPYSATSLYT